MKGRGEEVLREVEVEPFADLLLTLLVTLAADGLRGRIGEEDAEPISDGRRRSPKSPEPEVLATTVIGGHRHELVAGGAPGEVEHDPARCSGCRELREERRQEAERRAAAERQAVGPDRSPPPSEHRDDTLGYVRGGAHEAASECSRCRELKQKLTALTDDEGKRREAERERERAVGERLTEARRVFDEAFDQSELEAALMQIWKLGWVLYREGKRARPGERLSESRRGYRRTVLALVEDKVRNVRKLGSSGLPPGPVWRELMGLARHLQRRAEMGIGFGWDDDPWLLDYLQDAAEEWARLDVVRRSLAASEASQDVRLGG